MTKPDAIRKVKALRARALRGTTAAECAVAASKAWGLMAEYGVTEDDLREAAEAPKQAPGPRRPRESATNHTGAARNPHVPPPQPTAGPLDELFGQLRQELGSAIRDGFAGFREEFGQGMRQMGRQAGGRR